MKKTGRLYRRLLTAMLMLALCCGCICGSLTAQAASEEKSALPLKAIAGDVAQIELVGGTLAVLRTDGTVQVCMDVSKDNVLSAADPSKGVVKLWSTASQLDQAMYLLKEDGTVECFGSYWYQEIEDWTNVKELVFQKTHFYSAMGILKDGSVVTTSRADGLVPDPEIWKDICQISYQGTGTTAYGLRKDGTVVALGTENTGFLKYWKQVEELIGADFSYEFILGRCADGTVYGHAGSGKNAVSKIWRGIDRIIYAENGDGTGRNACILGCRKDGSVACLCMDGSIASAHERAYADWSDVVAVKILDNGFLGITQNGNRKFLEWEDLRKEIGIPDIPEAYKIPYRRLEPEELDYVEDVMMIGRNVLALYKDGSVVQLNPEGDLDPSRWGKLRLMKESDFGDAVVVREDGTAFMLWTVEERKCISAELTGWEDIEYVHFCSSWPFVRSIAAVSGDGTLYGCTVETYPEADVKTFRFVTE